MGVGVGLGWGVGGGARENLVKKNHACQVDLKKIPTPA